MKTAITSCKNDLGSATTNCAPTAAPMTVPIKNGVTIDINVWRQLSTARLRFEPNCTTPWIGTNAIGGNRFAIVANTNTPPPSPNAPAIRLPRNETMHSTKKPPNDKPVPAINDSTMPFK